MIIKDKIHDVAKCYEDIAFNEMCKYQFVEMIQKDAKIFELYEITFTMAVVLSSKANLKF